MKTTPKNIILSKLKYDLKPIFKSYFDFDKMIFFGIVFILYFLKLSDTSGFWWLSFAIFFHIVGLIFILTFLSLIPISTSLSSSVKNRASE